MVVETEKKGENASLFPLFFSLLCTPVELLAWQDSYCLSTFIAPLPIDRHNCYTLNSLFTLLHFIPKINKM